KGKLVRSMAVCEESSPFEETQVRHTPHTHTHAHTQTDTQSSLEYTDSTGIDLHQFIVDTLNSNPRDRMMLLKLEQDMIDFITSNSPFKKFPHMSSYHRMLVHRVAAYFGMEHNVDQTGKSVIINRTSSTRIPEQRFLDEVHKDKTEEIHRWKIILKRDNSSDDQTRLHPLQEKQSKSMEEREEEYQRVRDRIFNQEVRQIETEKEEDRQADIGDSLISLSRQSSTDTDCRYGNDPPPWSSMDSDSSYQLPSACPHPPTPPVVDEPAPNSAYIMENGIPPGSILVNPHTGQPFLNPDGTPAVYNPPDSQQPIRSQTQLQGSPSQQQVGHTQQEVFDTSDRYIHTYICVSIEELSSQFAHVSCQSAVEAPPPYPPGQGYIYAAPPPPPPPPNPPSYCQPSPQVHTHIQLLFSRLLFDFGNVLRNSC
uniref:cAMP-regulated phosphoprotein 21-like n=1 Tax=Sparus aurata TaxID=8175 RepID=A0A671U4G5_SPAAU